MPCGSTRDLGDLDRAIRDLPSYGSTRELDGARRVFTCVILGPNLPHGLLLLKLADPHLQEKEIPYISLSCLPLPPYSLHSCLFIYSCLSPCLSPCLSIWTIQQGCHLPSPSPTPPPSPSPSLCLPSPTQAHLWHTLTL